MQPQVSIVICVYNGEKTIGAAIESAMLQSYRDIEILVVNDASSDGTLNVVEAYAKQDSRIRAVSHETNKQLLEGRRTGVMAARAPYIMFLDADDTLRQSAVEASLELVSDSPEELSIAHLSIAPHFVGDISSEDKQSLEQYFRAYDGVLLGEDITRAAFREFTVSWNICGKLFAKRLLELTFDSLPSCRVFEMEDALLFFITSINAEYYKGKSDSYSIDYGCDAGDSISFLTNCQIGHAISVLDDYLEKSGLKTHYWEDFSALKNRQLIGIAGRFLQQDSVDIQRQGYEILLKYFDVIEVDAALDEFNGDSSWKKALALSGAQREEEPTDSVDLILRYYYLELKECEDKQRYPIILARIAQLCSTFVSQRDVLRMFESFEFPDSSNHAESIAQYYYRAGNGGVERVLVELATLFASGGKQSLVITGDSLNAESYDIADEVRQESVRTFGESCTSFVQVADHLGKLAALLRENHVDVYVYHAWLSAQCIWDLLLCKLLGVKFVLVTHGVFSFPLTLTIPERSCFSLVPRIAALSDAVVSLTETNRYYYSKFNSNTFAIPNPLPHDLVQEVRNSSLFDLGENPNRLLSKNPVVLWLGRFDEGKRPLDAIRAMKLVVDEIPEAQLVMVGKSETGEYESILRDKVNELGIAHSVVFEGYQKEVARYYKDADVFLFTSDIEGYPMVLIEAAAAGVPVVMYDLPYLATATCDDWIATAPVGDIDTVATQLKNILFNQERHHQMKRAAVKFAQNLAEFDYLKAWDQVLNCQLREKNVFEQNEIEGVLWATLFEHSLRSSTEVEKLRKQLIETGNVLNTIRDEYETSNSWRLGRMITACPRKIKSIFKRSEE